MSPHPRASHMTQYVRCIKDSHEMTILPQPAFENSLKGSLIIGKVYEVISVEHNFYRLVDDTEEDYLFPAELFEIQPFQYD
jgi:hypothetical protein